MNDVNKRIVEFMKANGIDETELALKIGKDKSTAYRITSGKTIPSRTTLQLIGNAYNVDYKYFLAGKSIQNANKFPPKIAENPWKEEAYARLVSEMEYLKLKYDQVLAALINGKGGNLGKSKALKFAEMFKQAA